MLSTQVETTPFPNFPTSAAVSAIWKARAREKLQRYGEDLIELLINPYPAINPTYRLLEGWFGAAGEPVQIRDDGDDLVFGLDNPGAVSPSDDYNYWQKIQDSLLQTPGAAAHGWKTVQQVRDETTSLYAQYLSEAASETWGEVMERGLGWG